LLVEQFVAAANGGDVQTLAGLLATDAVLISDGGGKAAAALNPIHGFDRIIRFWMGIASKAPADTRLVLVEVNAELALVSLVGGRPTYVTTFEVVDGRILMADHRGAIRRCQRSGSPVGNAIPGRPDRLRLASGR